MSITDKPNVRIYILCYNQERFANAAEKYRQYYWAIPILMKYQDDTCENAFWKQLLEIKHEWEHCEMVGTLSYTAFTKVSLSDVNSIICNRRKWEYGYYYFMQQNHPIRFWFHPNMETIITDVCNVLHRKIPMENNCNYMMCTPSLMKNFIQWITKMLIPVVKAHPLIMNDSRYPGVLTTDQCMALFKKPYYTMTPFILERLTCTFFSKKIILVSHENSKTGASTLLNYVYKYLQDKNYTVTMCYSDSNTWGKIYTTSLYNDITVVCNTIVCDNLVEKCIMHNIPVIWYLHEWIDNTYWKSSIKDKTIFSRANKLIFPCNNAYNNYLTNVSTDIISNSIIIPYGYDFDRFEKNRSSPITLIKEKDALYLCIVGSVETRKNQNAFINNVFIPLLNKLPNIYLILVGKVHTSITDHSHIIVIGEVDNPIPYINISDIIISYSINESIPMNVIEACLCKKAIIASNVGGTSEVIKDNYSGFLVEVNDHVTTTNKLLEFINNPELRTTYGENAYKDAKQNYNQDNNFSQLATCIDSFTGHII
jgi:glycosyltransferase involved in cell wall biosynthesis